VPQLRRRNADEELRRVYRAHVRAVYAFFAYSLSRESAEDLTSSTFERVIKAYDRFDPAKASERTWILTIARNLLTDHYRRERLRTTVSTDQHPALLDRLVQQDDPLIRQLSASGILEWLRDLSSDAQEVLALRFGADLATKEIALLTGHSEANVDQMVSRSLRRLRQRAETEGVSGGSV
jgi:RNA polymerase sigma-70 factor (ECF subfamily)